MSSSSPEESKFAEQALRDKAKVLCEMELKWETLPQDAQRLLQGLSKETPRDREFVVCVKECISSKLGYTDLAMLTLVGIVGNCGIPRDELARFTRTHSGKFPEYVIIPDIHGASEGNQ
jgi:hypothetical protein